MKRADKDTSFASFISYTSFVRCVSPIESSLMMRKTFLFIGCTWNTFPGDLYCFHSLCKSRSVNWTLIKIVEQQCSDWVAMVWHRWKNSVFTIWHHNQRASATTWCHSGVVIECGGSLCQLHSVFLMSFCHFVPWRTSHLLRLIFFVQGRKDR